MKQKGKIKTPYVGHESGLIPSLTYRWMMAHQQHLQSQLFWLKGIHIQPCHT